MTKLLDLLPDKVVHILDDWRVWVAIAYFALAALTVWAVVITTRTAHASASAAKEQAIRQATIKADYRSCVRSIPSLTSFREFVGGVNDLADILVTNSLANINSFPPDDPQQPTRRDNLERIVRAQKRIASVRTFPLPTPASCEAKRVAAELQNG